MLVGKNVLAPGTDQCSNVAAAPIPEDLEENMWTAGKLPLHATVEGSVDSCPENGSIQLLRFFRFFRFLRAVLFLVASLRSNLSFRQVA